MLSLVPNVVMTQDETGAVLLDQRTGRYWMMNDTGLCVLRCLLSGGSVEEAVQELCTKYPHTEPTRAEQDTRMWLEQLRTSGLVTT